MDPHRFLDLAGDWASGTDEGEWRSASSRAYYATFHVARRLLSHAGFRVPPSDQAHRYLWLRFSNTGNSVISRVGGWLYDLRSSRNEADYDIDNSFEERTAVRDFNLASECIDILEALEGTPDILTQVIDAIRVYERDVLHEVTFSSP